MAFTTSKANDLLNSNFKNIYIGLSSSAPNEDGGNFSEPAISKETGYTRGDLSDCMGSAANRQIQNTKVCYMTLLRQSCGTATHFGLFSSASGGTPFFYGALTTSVPLTANHIPVVDVGGIVIGLDKSSLDAAKTWEQV